MKLKLLPYLVVFAALTPALACSQNTQFANCHTPESAGNFVGPNETIVNGMICTVIKTQAGQQQTAIQQAQASGVPAQVATGQAPEITNARVIEMSKLGLDDEIIIARIKHGTCHFQLADADLVQLKRAGVSAKVIAAMLDVVPETPAAPSNATAPAAADPVTAEPAIPSDGKVRVLVGPPPVDEVGVYFQSGGKWTDLPPEVVNWKTGGVIKHVGTLGVVKGDVNGKIRGGTSRSHLKQPVALLVYAPEGTAITEYQLIKFRTHSDSREFRTVTGGVLHVSGGADRDTLDFTPKHIAQRTWTISLGDLKPGEFGLLPPGLSNSSSASAQLGKIYTFSIPEAK